LRRAGTWGTKVGLARKILYSNLGGPSILFLDLIVNLFSMNSHVLWRLDTDSNLFAADFEYDHFYLIAYYDALL
jgi:hypothetical protein